MAVSFCSGLQQMKVLWKLTASNMPSSNIEYGHEDCPGIVAKSYNGQAGISMLNAVVHFQETSEG